MPETIIKPEDLKEGMQVRISLEGTISACDEAAISLHVGDAVRLQFGPTTLRMAQIAAISRPLAVDDLVRTPPHGDVGTIRAIDGAWAWVGFRGGVRQTYRLSELEQALKSDDVEAASTPRSEQFDALKRHILDPQAVRPMPMAGDLRHARQISDWLLPSELEEGRVGYVRLRFTSGMELGPIWSGVVDWSVPVIDRFCWLGAGEPQRPMTGKAGDWMGD